MPPSPPQYASSTVILPDLIEVVLLCASQGRITLYYVVTEYLPSSNPDPADFIDLCKRKLLEGLARSLRELPDITFTFSSGKELYCHSKPLAASSTYFRCLLNGGFLESRGLNETETSSQAGKASAATVDNSLLIWHAALTRNAMRALNEDCSHRRFLVRLSDFHVSSPMLITFGSARTFSGLLSFVLSGYETLAKDDDLSLRRLR